MQLVFFSIGSQTFYCFISWSVFFIAREVRRIKKYWYVFMLLLFGVYAVIIFHWSVSIPILDPSNCLKVRCPKTTSPSNMFMPSMSQRYKISCLKHQPNVSKHWELPTDLRHKNATRRSSNPETWNSRFSPLQFNGEKLEPDFLNSWNFEDSYRKTHHFQVLNFGGVHPGRLTAGTQSWRFGSDHFPFQMGDL